ncbi:MAG: hypothetical protein U0894_01685 [Pirellulales bacterium]
MESRDHYLPWYELTRAFDVSLGGIMVGFARLATKLSRPSGWWRITPAKPELGRGSPRESRFIAKYFPEKYQGAAFCCLLTCDESIKVPLKEQGLSNAMPESPEVFLQTAGTVGFAPVWIW